MDVIQGNERNAQVLILDNNEDTVHNVRRTIRNVTSNEYIKKGRARIQGRVFNVVFDQRSYKWIGNAYDHQ
jgi:hypothetical protein